MSTLTERHRALNINEQSNPGAWTVGNNGSGTRNWFALRKQPQTHTGPYEYYSDVRGDMIWLTEAGALKRAELLNSEPER
jgi:hypothetical protein